MFIGTTSLNDIVVNEDHISAVDDLKGNLIWFFYTTYNNFKFACLIGTDKAYGISNEDQISELAKLSG